MSQRWPILAALVLGCAPPPRELKPSIDPVSLTPLLEAQFTRSAAAWNRGDLDSFMLDYLRDSLTSFVSGGHLHHGYDFIKNRYAPRFAPGAPRDSLRFEEFSVRPVDSDFALVNARYILYRNGAVTASGPFTLLMQHRPEGWKILHDHSSSD